MTVEDWLNVLFWLFAPAYGVGAFEYLFKSWKAAAAQNKAGLPWYGITVAGAGLFGAYGFCNWHGPLTSPTAKILIMSVLTALAWLLILHRLNVWPRGQQRGGKM